MKARLIPFYLPQYHPIPENDKSWGKGFTEWTNVTKAKPLFRGHYQPNLPSELGFYDLRVPEVRIAQAELAREHGIEGFCYWHYWLGNGRRLLERPFQEVLESGQPNFPFCLAWANHTWSGIWDGCPDRILVQQTYPGKEDYKAHFEAVLAAFRDERYLTVNGKPIFVVFRPNELPDPVEFTDYWRELAIKAGLPGLYLVGISYGFDWDPKRWGFDAYTSNPPRDMADRIPKWIIERVFRKLTKKDFKELLRNIASIPVTYDYREIVRFGIPKVLPSPYFLPTVVPNWDNTPRSGVNGIVFKGSTPELFGQHLQSAIQCVQKCDADKRIVFIKSWNEWAEGNYLEPDRQFGKAYLEAVKAEIFDQQPVVSPQCVAV